MQPTSPVKAFKDHEVIFAANQPEYLPLPALQTKDGIVITCWRLSFVERLKMLVTGKIFIQLMTFNKPLQPIYPSVDQPVVSIICGGTARPDELTLKYEETET